MAEDSGVGEPAEAGEIEGQLEKQVAEQRESLAAVDEALAVDPSNPELLAVHEELISAIKEAEEGLRHLKRSRLIEEADALLSGLKNDPLENVEVEPLDSRIPEAEPLEATKFSVGSRCRFRHTDGRWYNGQILSFEDANYARISFLTPTSESMLMCKFFLQQRCRFGSSCRMSHGFDVPLSSLKQYIPTMWQQSLVGSTIWASSGIGSSIWRRAELESWDEEHELGQVVFIDDGSSANLGSDLLSISRYAEMSDDEEEDYSGSGGSELEEDLENGSEHEGLGFLESTKLQKGIQTETAIFADWEHHTRGVASKMMASMGYRKGAGLGISGQGIIDPISVKVLPKKQSLDDALASSETPDTAEGRAKKRSRGGRRIREKKDAALARAAKAEEEQESDIFSFINNQLAAQDAATGQGGKPQKGSHDAAVNRKREDRLSLVVYEDEMKDLRSQVEKLEDMLNRNRKDKVVYEAALRKLNDTRKALADTEALHASATSSVVNKEKEKKWLKF